MTIGYDMRLATLDVTDLAAPGTSVRNTFASEWTKLRSLRSTWVTLLGAGALSALLAALVAATEVNQWDEWNARQRADFDATSHALIGVLFATVFIGALGVRSIASEYSTGMIRLTFTAVPQRRRVVLAKATIVAALALPAALVSNVGAFFIGQAIYSSKDMQASATDGGATRAIVLGSAAIASAGILGVGLGTLIKRTTLATTALSVALIGSQLFEIALPKGARKYLPGSTLQAVVTGKSSDDLLAPLSALLLLIGYALFTFAIASVLITRRDA
jgi:ABC-type transport system involved in multi-copper enzyme maturation permease subunit